jgi:C-terminal processing protease CtpA/Prc
MPDEIGKRLDQLEKAKAEQVVPLLHDARAFLGSRSELAERKDFEICLAAIFAKLEPGARPEERSSYIPPEKVLRLHLGGPRGKLVGIGLEVEVDSATGNLRVVTPIFDGPAYNAGIRAGDIITQIRVDTDRDGKPLPKPGVHSTKGMSVARANELFVGMADTRVVLVVTPPGSSKR